MKWKILFLIFAMKLEFVQLDDCSCTESPAQCQDVHKCLNCEFNCERVHSNFTEENCATLLLETGFNAVEWRKASSECRSLNCSNVAIDYNDSNRTVYWKTCDPGCSAFTATEYHYKLVMTNYSAANTTRYSDYYHRDNCFRKYASLSAQNWIVTFEPIYINSDSPDHYDCKVYPGCNTSACLLEDSFHISSYSYMINCNETGLECGGVQNPPNGVVNASAGTKFGAKAVYSCESGYNLSGPSTRLCLITGNWNTSAPSCSPVDCGPTSHPANGSANFTTTTYKSQATYICERGFLLNGNYIRTCQDNGQWNGSIPMCTIKDCGQPTQPGNGSVNYTTTTFNSLATYSCNTEYNLNGSTITTCQDVGQWSGYTPTCTIKDCSVPSQPGNGTVNYQTTTFNSSATYSCNTGYNLTGSANTTCQDNGQWSGSAPTCTIKDCGQPSQPGNGSVNYTTTTFNSSATYSCNTGYNLTGSANTTCQDNGQWSGSAPTCTIKDCGEPSQPGNGSVIYTTTTFNSSATYSCNTGYNLTGSANTSCQANGQWSGSAPTCTIKDCGQPSQPGNGSVNYTTTTFNSSATYSCNTGYNLNGSADTTCQDNGQWNGSTPACTIIDCGQPSQPGNGSVIYTTTTFNSSAMYSCNTGYNFNGSANTICQANGQWSSSTPTCTIKDCGQPSQPGNGSVIYTTTTFNSSATYSCNAGYNLNDSADTTCQDNGQWNGSTPACTIKDCGQPSQPGNGSANITTTTFSSNVTYICNTGFRLHGSNITQCESTGNWSDATPSCIIEDCGPHLLPANGTVNYTTTTFNSSATYRCNAGFLLTGSSNSTCISGGNWSDSPPNCKFIDCGVPHQVENGHVYFNDTTYGREAVYVCNQGFNISGQSRRTCNENGFWGPSVPYCLAPGQTITRPRLYIKPCICYSNRTFVNMTQDQILAHLVKETSIDTKNTSAALDKLRSRSDSRTSSAVIGTIGIVILSTLGGLILCSDLLTICRNRDAKKRQTK